MVSLCGPLWMSSQHVWWVEEWISEETKLGRKCKDSEHSLRNHTSGIGPLIFKGKKYGYQISMKCQYMLIRLFLENTIHQIILDYLNPADLLANFNLMNKPRRDLCKNHPSAKPIYCEIVNNGCFKPLCCGMICYAPNNNTVIETRRQMLP